MADVGIYHPFISKKHDSFDATLVSSPEWNEALVLKGGTNGQKVVYDDTQSNNFRYSDGGIFAAGNQAISGSTASPITNFAQAQITTTTAGIAIVSLVVYTYTSSSGHAIVDLFVDTVSAIQVQIVSGIGAGSQSAVTGIHGRIVATPGVHTAYLRFVTSTGSNFLTLSASTYISFWGT